MKVEIISCLSDNYSYLIYENETNTVTLVDPSDFKKCDSVINKYKKLDFILNTHHHIDHVDGNLELKKKYNSKIIGFCEDKKRIPGIDILLKDNQNFKIGKLEFKVFFIPGHTKGHIAFYFEKEKTIFTGDTLFSLGCGKSFEGHSDMLELNKLKKLPFKKKIYCVHEYTKKNLEFCKKFDPNKIDLEKKEKIINSKLVNKLPTIPTTIKEELKTNIFLRCNDTSIKKTLNLQDASEKEVFTKLRDLKDNF